jgi:pimeloyl-ACP methyl ester carboxylesterase
MELFADDLAWVCRELALDRPVVIGHSMGGVVALAMAARFPEIVRAAVFLDSPVMPLVVGVPEFLAATIDGMRGPAYRDVAREMLANAFSADFDPIRREEILDTFCAHPQHVMVSAMEAPWICDKRTAAANCKQPLLHVAAQEGISDLALFRQLAPQLQTGQTVGAGHWIQLEVPDQVNAMLERFLAVFVVDQTVCSA